MATHIFKANNIKDSGILFVNHKRISIEDYRRCRYNDLEQHEIDSLENYLKANKL